MSKSGAPGWDAVRKQASAVPRTGRFFIKDGETKKIQFLENEPFCIYQHTLQVDGKWQSFTCLQGSGEECPLCEKGTPARFVGLFTVIDHSEEDKRWKYKVFTQGIRVLKQLERLAAKPKGMNGYIFEISRTGNGVDTSYNFDTYEERPLTAEDKKMVSDFIEVSAPMKRADLQVKIGDKPDSSVPADEPDDDLTF